jgi:hypothetical protein
MIGRIWLRVEHGRNVNSRPVGSLWPRKGNEAVDDIDGSAEETIDVELEDTDRNGGSRRECHAAAG